MLYSPSKMLYSPASSYGSSPDARSPVGRMCVVCGRSAKFHHYGVICCEACCVFFKRTILQPGKQTCHCAKRNFRLGIKGRMFPCSYCRLKQCFAAGMTVPGVYSFTDLAAVYGLKSNGEFPLRDVAALRQALSVSRVRTLAEFGIDRIGARTATHPSLSAFYTTEIRLLENFLLSRNEIHGFLRTSESLEYGASDFFPTWTVFETLVLTAKHLGFLKHQLHMVDGSVVNLNINDLSGYCSTIPNVKDPQSVARLCLDKFTELLDFSANLHRTGADDVEIAALFELVFAHYATMWFDDASARTTFINGVLRDLEFHYAQSGGDVATRMGAMMALFGEFHHVQQLCEECHVIIELCSYMSEFKPHIARDGTVVRAPRGILT